MRDSLIYNDDTKVKDLTVGELKDIIKECYLDMLSYNAQVKLECIGRQLKASTNTEQPYC